MSYIWRGALQWWDDWQLRILVPGSLGLQWFLLLAAPMRKYALPRVLRTFIWLAYISSDPLAIYALATLFNRHAKTSNFGGDTGSEQQSSILEVLWAPILLICLGGQEEMTGYEIEDNKLWGRHTVTLVSQVAVALYAFYKSWPRSSDPKLLVVAVLLFVVGVVSFSEKPWAIKAKTRRLAAVSSSGGQRKKKPSRWRERMNQFFFSVSNCFTCTRMPQSQLLPDGCFTCTRMPQSQFLPGGEEEGSRKQVILTEADRVLMVLADMSLLAAAKDLVAQKKTGRVEDVLRPLPHLTRALPCWLRIIFEFHYTREHVVGGPNPLYLLYHRLVIPILHIAALTLFAMSGKHPYKRTDVKITYIIMCLTATMHVLAPSIHQLLYWLISKTNATALCEMVPSYNLIDTALREGDKNIGWIYMCARSMGFNCNFNCFCRPQLGQVHHRQVAETVIPDLMDTQDRDLASYRIFDSNNWVLSKELQEHCGVEIKKCLRVSFDRSVLLWHIATDLCFRCDDLVDDVGKQEAGYGGGLQGGGGRVVGVEEVPQQQMRRDPLLQLDMEGAFAISNYMVHLLKFNPEMLLTGSRHHLISEAMEEIKSSFLSKDKLSQKDQLKELIAAMVEGEPKSVDAHDDTSAYKLEEDTLKELIAAEGEHKSVDAHDDTSQVLVQNTEACKLEEDKLKEFIANMAEGQHKSVNGHDDTSQVFVHITEACKLAKELLEVPDPKTRWKLMYRAWLGMLCYSASMCRGYLHAKSLGEGGEFLTYVWLVLMLKGAKSLVDKLQMPPETPPSDDARFTSMIH